MIKRLVKIKTILRKVLPKWLVRYIYYSNILSLPDYIKFERNKIIVEINIKNIHRKVFLRGSNWADLSTAKNVFYKKNRYHIPPFKIPVNSTILDLGSNIGLTILDYKMTYPDSRIIGVEMDKENFELCKLNTSHLKDVTLVNKAISEKNGVVTYSKNSESDAFSIMPDSSDKGIPVSIESITIDSLMDDLNLKEIDFVKMDIEGAEAKIFENINNLNWLNRTKSFYIEFHNNFPTEHVKSDLSKVGFEIINETKHWTSFFGTRVQ